MADNTAKTTGTPEQRLDAIIGKSMDGEGKAAIVTVLKASPGHADDILKSLDKYVDERTSLSSGFSASAATKDTLKKSFTDAAIDYSVRTGGKDEDMVKALTVIAAKADKPVAEDKVRTDLHAAAKAEEEYRKKQADAVAAGKDPEDTPEFKARKKKAEEEAEAAKKAQQKSSGDLGDDFWGGLMKMIVKAVAGWLGINLDESVKADSMPSKEPVQLINDKGEKTTRAGEDVINFLKNSGVEVPATEKPADGMWAAIDKMRKEAGLTERVGKHELDGSDVKMIDKIHNDHEAAKTKPAAKAEDAPAVTTAALTTKNLTEEQLHVLVASNIKHPEMAKHVDGDEGKLRAAVAQFQKNAGIVEDKGKEGLLDDKTIGALVAGYAKANGLSDKDAAKVNQHLNDDVMRITAAPTPPKVEVAANGQHK